MKLRYPMVGDGEYGAQAAACHQEGPSSRAPSSERSKNFFAVKVQRPDFDGMDRRKKTARPGISQGIERLWRGTAEQSASLLNECRSEADQEPRRDSLTSRRHAGQISVHR